MTGEAGQAPAPGQAARFALAERLTQAAVEIKNCRSITVVCASCEGEISAVLDAADAYAAAAQEPAAADDPRVVPLDPAVLHQEVRRLSGLVSDILGKLDNDFLGINLEDIDSWHERADATPAAERPAGEPPKLPLLADMLDERDRAREQRDEAKADWRKVRYERDKLRGLLDEIGVMAANAPEEGDSFGVLEEIAMRIGAAGVPNDDDDPFGVPVIRSAKPEVRTTAARPAAACPECAHVSMTPAVARPPSGSVLVLAVGADQPDESVRAAAEALAATEEGVTVVTVRGVEALRVWEPAAAGGTQRPTSGWETA